MNNRARELFKVQGAVVPLEESALPVGFVRSYLPSWIWGITRLVVFFVILIVLLKASVFEAFYVPSSSMQPTLKRSDYILVPKFAYGLRLPFLHDTIVDWSTPSRGDVIVFFHESGVPWDSGRVQNGNLVKRVIGVEGDTVEVRGAHVIINGEEIREPYALWDLEGREPSFGPVRVPEKKVFVMGDNRDDSQDSRFWQDPFVNVDSIQGRVLLVYWSSSDARRVGTFVN